MLKRVPLYPVLFAIFPVLSLAAYNIDEISPEVILRPLLLSLLLGAALLGLAGWVLRDWQRAALAVLAVLFFFFIYGQIYSLLEDVTVGGVSIFRHRTLLPLFGILALIALYLVVRRLHLPGSLTFGLNLLAIFLLIYPASQILWSVLQQRSADRSIRSSYSRVTAGGTRPDIYYIILDAYGRADVLQDVTGYDNSSFLNSLRQRGFYVAECSQSNYAYTEFSLASSLNYDYLDNLNVSHARSERIALLKHNAVRSFLEANGYTIVAFPTGWAYTEWKDADRYIDFENPVTSLTEFETLLLDTTALRAFYDLQSLNPGEASHKDLRRLRVLSLLDNLKKLPGTGGDLFVFAHMVVPHPPYTFAANGDVPAFEGRGSSSEENAAAYVEQLKFVNKEVLEVVDTLLRDSDAPPVIIIQGDHGPLPDIGVEGPRKLPILNAYYLPGIAADQALYASITPVNSFRVVLSSYFGQDLPRLEDQSYFAPLEDRNEFEPVPNTCPDEP
jgi:hypothetical protein